jgi:hypothetical protein
MRYSAGLQGPGLARAQQQRCGGSSGVRRLPGAVAARRCGRAPLSLRVRAEAADPETTPKPSADPASGANGSSNSSGSGVGPATQRALSGAAASSNTNTTSSSLSSSQEEEGFSWTSFWAGPLPGKLAGLLGLIVLSRVGVYVRLPGVDVDAFGETMAGNGLLGYVDALSGGSISKVGLFSLGIIPYINASIVLQLFSAAFPGLKKMQREDGPQGRAKFQYLQKLAAFAFAIAQVGGGVWGGGLCAGLCGVVP